MIVPHESCENWVFELAMCPVDSRYLAHRICVNFLSAAKMQGSHWGCGYTRRASPDHLTISSSLSSFPKEQTLPPFKHHWPSLPGTGQSWLIHSYFTPKRYEVSLKRHTQYKSKWWNFNWRWGQEKHNRARRMSRNLHFLLWCPINLLKVDHWFHSGFLPTSSIGR